MIPIIIIAGDSNQDESVAKIGFFILSAAVTIKKAKEYEEDKMKDGIQAAIDIKPTIVAAMGGGALSLTATNVISLAGLCVAVIAAVIGALQWRENRRRNNLLELEINWKMRNSGAGKKVK